MLGFGVKRKLDEDEDRLEADGGVLSSARQRQTLLNVSLGKLYGPRTGGALGLQRRVLINNVIRRLHAGVRQDGGADPGRGAGLFFFAAAPPVSAAAANEDESFRPPPPPSSFSLLCSPLSGPTAPDSCLTPALLLEDDLPVFFAPPPSPRPASPPPKDSFSSALEEIEELCPSTPPPPAAGVLIDAVMKEKAPPPLLPPPPSPAGSFLTDFSLDDVLFTDIDTSMYDLGPGPPPPPPPSKPHPAVTAEDLVRSLSAGYAAAGGGAQTQPFKMDLAELDQIMEVLVGS